MSLVNRGVFTFGKHAGHAVADVARADSGFLRWVLESKVQLALAADECIVCERAWLEVAVPPPPPPPPVLREMAREVSPLPPSSEAVKIVGEGEPNGGQMLAVPAAAFRKQEGWTVGGGGPPLDLMPSAAPEPPMFDLGFGFASHMPAPQPAFEWTDDQSVALDRIDAWWRKCEEEDPDAPWAFTLGGAAGTGKTTLVREIVARYPGAILTAMTGKAALRLSELAGRSASTLHAAMYWPPMRGESDFTRLRESPGEFVVIDEVSMMGPQVFQHLRSWGPRVLLVGDPFQLPPVVTGRELDLYGEDYSVFREVEGVELTTVLRNAGGVLRAATHVRETGDVCRDSGDGYEYVRAAGPITAAVERWLAAPEDHLLITWRNEIRMRATKMIRQRLGKSGPLPDAGEPVLIRRNGQGLLNGEILTCGGFEVGPVIGGLRTMWMFAGTTRVLVSVEGREEFFDGGLPNMESWKAYHVDLKKQNLPDPIPATWGYVLTMHAAQGSQADRATVFLERADLRNPNFKKSTTLPSGAQVSHAARWLYTAISRSRKSTTLVVGS